MSSQCLRGLREAVLRRLRPRPAPVKQEDSGDETEVEIDVVNDNMDYEVEQVIGKKSDQANLYYHLKWKGYAEATWEPEGYCQCDDLIKEYEKTFKENYAKEHEQRVDGNAEPQPSTSGVNQPKKTKKSKRSKKSRKSRKARRAREAMKAKKAKEALKATKAREAREALKAMKAREAKEAFKAMKARKARKQGSVESTRSSRCSRSRSK